MNKKFRPEKIELRYRKFKDPTKEKKPKLNIDLQYATKIMIAIALFMLIDTIFLLLIIVFHSGQSVDILISKGYSNSSAKFLVQIKDFGFYIIDWGIMFIFMVTILLGRRRAEYGYFFGYFWIVVISVLLILPFASPANGEISYIKSGLLLLPGILIYTYMLFQINDLKWTRRSWTKSIERRKYV